MEHIEEAGIHSGDSAMVLPPYTLSENTIKKIKEATKKLAKELKVCGLMNVQYAVKGDKVYILEVNPRASRTIPFISKAIGVPLANLATKVMLGKSLKELGFTKEIEIKHFAVKESVFPFVRFSGVDAILGPEMKSTGEVMGIDSSFGLAYAKSQIAAGQRLPKKGKVFLSVKDRDKRSVILIARRLSDLGFSLIASKGTADTLRRNDIPIQEVLKVYEGRPNITDLIKNGEVSLIINTPSGKRPKKDTVSIRSVAISRNIPLITTIAGAEAAVGGLEAILKRDFSIKSIQDYHKEIKSNDQ